MEVPADQPPRWGCDEYIRRLKTSLCSTKAVVESSADHGQTGQACCTNCNGTGYKGRLGLYEVMSINDEMRGLILKHATADTIRECSKRQGMQSLLDYGMNLVKQQLTTLAEVERVCVIEEPEDA